MMSRFRVRLFVVLISIAVIASACAGDGSPEDATAEDGEPKEDTEASVAAYVESVEAISADTEAIVTDAFESVFAESEVRSLESLLPEFSAALSTVISAERDALARFEALDPPQAFVADQERAIVFGGDRIEALARQQAAADSGDTELIAQIDLELENLAREALADWSPEFAQHVATSDSAVATALLFSELDTQEAEYLNAVASGWDEFAKRNRAFSEALQQSYTSDELLLLALLDAGAGEAFAAVRGVIVEIDPPQSYVEGHAQLLAYLDETVALDATIAEAADAGDVVAFEVANYRLGLAGARFALEAPASLVAVNADPVDLVPPEDLPGGAYGGALWGALQRFRILALRQTISSGVFPVVSDAKLAQTIAEVMPTAIQLTEEAVASVEALAPPEELEVGHDRILTYLGALVELRLSISQAAAAGDLETLRTYGEIGGFAAERAETELWCAARADVADDPIEPITAAFFKTFEAVTEAELCGAA